MSGIFISYRRSDSRGSAGRIYDNLEARFGRERVFRDLDALEPGAVYEGAIETFIASCDAVVAVIGNLWLEVRDDQGRRRVDDPGDLVRREIEAALTQGKLVIPVLVEDAVMPSADELPGGLAALAARNALPISDTRWDYDVGRLVQTLERSLGPAAGSPTPEADRSTPPTASVPPPAPAPTQAPASAPARHSRGRTFALIALGVVLTLILGAALSGGDTDEGGDTADTGEVVDTGVDGEEEPIDEAETVVSLEPASADPGTDIVVSGSGFQAGETVTLTVDGEPFMEGTVDEDGDFEESFTLPEDSASGEYEIVATGNESELSSSETLEVP